MKTFFSNQSRILKPMPPLEFLVSSLFISKGIGKKDIKKSIWIPQGKYPKHTYETDGVLNDEKGIYDFVNIDYSVEGALLDIYTEGELYSTLNNTKRFVLFSRAFELLIYSFFIDESDLSFDVIDKIIRKKPFYSIINLAETKISIEGDKEEVKDEHDKGWTSVALFGEIIKWRRDNAEIIDGFDSVSLIPIFSYVFNSVFTAMNVIKANYSSASNDSYKDEHLSDMVLRFKYNLLNAVLRSGIYGEAVYANALISAKSETVRNPFEISSKDKTYTRNMSIVNQERKRLKNTKPEQAKRLKDVLNLHDAIEKHPIFSILITNEKIYSPLLRLGKASASKSDKQVSNTQALISLIGSAEKEASILLQEIRVKISSQDAIRKDLKAKSASSHVKNAIATVKAALPLNFEATTEFENLNARCRNLLKVINRDDL
ncbi:hypothetical protein [Vibrio brasiliensis]|uniref:hypothetical protein n=1 Tax=Vibrio brasiliensis TaxID=170652 RepID=UPI0002E52ED3|nr:hypothetical protein [Vibrio brasiliensis]